MEVEVPALSEGYVTAQSSFSCDNPSEYHTADSGESVGVCDDEVTGRPMEPGLAPETGALLSRVNL